MAEDLLNPLEQPSFDMSTLETGTYSLYFNVNIPMPSNYDTGHQIVGIQKTVVSGDANGVNGGNFSLTITFEGTKLLFKDMNIGYGGGFGSANITYLYIPD